ncbi:hypothetical protein DN545_33145, partial [Burkholderia multivorans]
MRTRALSLTISAATALALTASLGTTALAADPTESSEPTDPPATDSGSGSGAGSAPPATKNLGDTAIATHSARAGAVTGIDLDADEVTILGATWNGDDPGLEIRYKQSGT